jgi:Pyruvate/2-oxoacid:ferredoxin oxidoreductase gamma subunit
VIQLEEFEQALKRYHNPRGEYFFSGARAEKNIQAARIGYENLKFLEG